MYACNCNVAREKEIMGKRNVQIPNDYYILYLRRSNLLMSKRSLSVTSVNLITIRENRSESRSLCTSSTYDVVPFNLPGLLKSSQAVPGTRIHYRACPTTGGGSYCTLVCASLQWVSIQMRLGRHATLSHCRTSLHTLSPEEVRLVSLEQKFLFLTLSKCASPTYRGLSARRERVCLDPNPSQVQVSVDAVPLHACYHCRHPSYTYIPLSKSLSIRFDTMALNRIEGFNLYIGG